MRFYLNRTGVPPFPVVSCSFSQGLRTCSWVFEWDAEWTLWILMWACRIAMFSWHLYNVCEPGSRRTDTSTPLFWKGHQWCDLSQFSHLALFLSLIVNGKLHHSWTTHVLFKMTLWLLCFEMSHVIQWWFLKCEGRQIIPLEGLCIRVSARHLDILVRMFHLWRILAHCNDLLLFVDSMHFSWSLS